MKKIIILAITLSVATLTFAERKSIRGNTETWLQRSNNSLRGAPSVNDDTEGPDGDPTNPGAPIGNATGWMLVLSLSYCGYVVIRKQQKTNE